MQTLSENKPQRLSDVLPSFAPQGSNDARWFLVEHQLEQAITSARCVVGSLRVITQRPENEEELLLAEDCLSFMEAMLCDILGAKASFLSYLSGTDVSERISQKEL